MAFDFSSVRNKNKKSSGFDYSSVKGKTKRSEEERKEYTEQLIKTEREKRNSGNPSGRQATAYSGKYDAVAGKAGYSNYLDNRNKEDKKIDFGNLFSLAGYTAGSNTSLPNVAETSYGYEKDTAYKEPSDRWLEEEQNIFGYLWENDREAAEEYAIAVNNAINAYEKNLKTQRHVDYATENLGQGILASAASIGTNVLGGVDYLADLVEYNTRGIVTEKEDYVTPHEYTQAVRGAIAEDLNEIGTINEKIPVLGGRGFGDLYQVGMSAADSFALGNLRMADGTFLLSAASSAMDDAIKRGVSEGQAFAYGLTSGLAEAVFEHISIERMLKMKSPHTIKKAVKGILKQSVAEGAEEVGTEISNTLFDVIINHDKSELVATYANYISEGKSKAEAIARTVADLGGEVAWAGISGALAGSMSGTAQTAILKTKDTFGKTVRDTGTRKTIDQAVKRDKDTGKRIVDIGLQADEKSEAHKAAEAVGAKIERGETPSTKEYADILQKADESFAADDIRKQIAYEAEQNGESYTDEELDNMSTNLLKTMKGKLISEKDNAQIEGSKAAKNVYARNTGHDYVLGKEIEKEEMQKLNKNEHKRRISEYVSEQTEGFKQTLDNAYSSYKESGAQNLLEEEDFIDQFGAFYDLGRAGNESLDRVFEAFPNLSENEILKNSLERAYTFGKGEVESENIEQSKVRQNLTRRGVKGKVVFEGSAKHMARNKQQTATIELIDKVLSKASGIEFHIFSSYELEEDLSYVNKNGDKVSLKKGDRVYRDINNEVVSAPNGFYRPASRQIWVDLNAGAEGQGVMLYTITHELLHDIRVWSPEHYNTLLEITREAFEKNGNDFGFAVNAKYESYHEKHSDYTIDEAREEVVAEAMSGLLQNEQGLREFSAQIQQKDASLWNRIRSWFDNIIKRITAAYETLVPSSYEAKLLMEQKELFEKAQKIFAEAVVMAGQNYGNLSKAEVSKINAREDAGVSVIGDTVYLQLRQYKDTGRNALLEYFTEQSHGDVQTGKEIVDYLDTIANLIETVSEENPDLEIFSKWQEATPVLDRYGKPAFRVTVKNGEYKLNLDASRVCKKRRQLDYVLNILATNPDFQAEMLDRGDFLKINNIIRSHGFEVACALCFVDAKRFRQAEWAQSFAGTWNMLLEAAIGTEEFNKATPFNFATTNPDTSENNAVADRNNAVTYNKYSFDKDKVKTETISRASFAEMFKKKDGGKNYVEGNSNVRKMAQLILEHPEYRHKFRAADIISSNGFDSMAVAAPEIRAVLDGWGGSSVPKPSSHDAIYDNSVLLGSEYTIDEAYSVGGVRCQSFSDYVAHIFFDYCQIMADMEAKKLPMHSYAKELSYARLFGMTGNRINLSLVPFVRKKATGKLTKKEIEIEKRFAGLNTDRLEAALGKTIDKITDKEALENIDLLDYSWATESIDFKKSVLMQNGVYYDKFLDKNNNLTAKGEEIFNLLSEGNKMSALELAGVGNFDIRYANFVGTIAVGVSDIHIAKLLRDSNVRMVIPYHKSSIDPQIAAMMKIGIFNDYTRSQNTGVRLRNNKGRVNMSKLSGDGPKAQVGNVIAFDWYKYLRSTGKDVRDCTEAYLDWCERGEYNQETGEYGWFIKGENKDERIFINKEYLESKGVVPYEDKGRSFMFVPTFYKFINEENYYKVLIDFDPYNTLTGEYVPQGPVVLTGNLPADYKDVLLADLKAEQKMNNELFDAMTKEDKNTGKTMAAEIIEEVNKGKVKGRKIPEAISTDRRIPKSTMEFNKNFLNQQLYQDREPAPVFYSYMGRVVDGIKTEKIGANGVVSYLKGKGVKDEEIKWSGIETFLEGKKSVTKAELKDFIDKSMLQIGDSLVDNPLEFIELQNGDYRIMYNNDFDTSIRLYHEGDKWIDSENFSEWSSPQEAYKYFKEEYSPDESGRWGAYKLNGGRHYREILFTLPNSDYSNEAMRTHWGEDAKGIFAHARVQDFDTNDGKMLFIEEIQSDWHNAGQKKGYADEASLNLIDEFRKIMRKRRVYNEQVRPIVQYAAYALDLNDDTVYSELLKENWNNLSYFDKLAKFFTDEELEALKKDVELYKKQIEIKNKINEAGVQVGSALDAPFRNNYHEFVLKRLIREAAEKGYDSIGWTTADIQSDRWSDEYAEGYRIEYDQDIPKFLNKYGKKWGAKVGKTAIKNIGKVKSTFYDVNREETFESFTEWQNTVRETLHEQGINMRNVVFTHTDPFAEEEDAWVAYDRATDREYDRAVENIGRESTEVWSMPVTDSMRESVVYEGQTMYQERDSAYMDAVNKGDMETAQKMVDEAAKEAGYTARLFHGTNRFGFTVPKTEGLEPGMAWSPFFATDSEEVAKTYSGIGGTRWIADDSLSEESIDKAYDEAEKNMTDSKDELYFALQREFPYAFDFKDISKYADELCDDLHMGKTTAGDVDSDLYEYISEGMWNNWDEDYYEGYSDYDDWADSEDAEKIWSALNHLVNSIIHYAKVRDMAGLEDLGNYGLYAHVENFLEINANGKAWNQIPFDEYDTTGFRPNVNTRQLAQYAWDEGYGGVKISNVFDDGGRGPSQTKPATVYIFFDPQVQVKSADPVTKDDDGNVIPLSERFNETNEDIRWQERDANVDIDTQIGMTRAWINNIEDRLTDPFVNENSKSTRELRKKLDSLYKDLDNEFAEVRKQSKKTSLRTILDNLDKYKDLDLEGLANDLSENNWDFEEEGLFGKDLIPGIREMIETRMEDMTMLEQQSPKYGFFVRPVENREEIRHQERLSSADLNRIGILEDKAQRLEKEIADIERTYSKAQDYARAEGILIGQFEQGKMMATEFNKEKAKLQKDYEEKQKEFNKEYELAQDYARAEGILAGQIEQGNKMAREMRRKKESYEHKIKNYEDMIAAKRAELKKVRERRDQIFKEYKESFAAYREKRTETIKNSSLRKRIERKVKNLNAKLVRPSDIKHVPEDLRVAVAAVLENFVQDTSVFSASKLIDLQAAYKNILEDGGDISELYDEDIADNIDSLAKTIKGRRLSELNSTELKKIDEVVSSIIHMVNDGNKLFINGRKEDIEKIVLMTTETAKNKGLKEYRGGKLGEALAKAEKFFTSDNATPVYFFKHMGGGMEVLFKEMLYNRQLVYANDVVESDEFMKQMYDKYNVWDWTSKNVKNKDVFIVLETENGNTLKLTTNEALSLYATYKRGIANGDNAAHIMQGGVVLKPKAANKVNEKWAMTAKGTPLTVEDMKKVFKELPEYQRNCADEIVEYLSVVDGKKRNETSMELHGYKKFGEKYYFPYKVASDYIASKPGAQVDENGLAVMPDTSRLKNMGSSKALKPKANAPIVLDDFFDVVAGSMKDTANYHAYAVIQDNFMRVLNYKTAVDKEGLSGSESVKQVIREAYGSEGVNYISKMLEDVFGGSVHFDHDFLGGFFGKFKKTAVAANLQVAIQQPSAILRATAFIDPKYLLKTVGQPNVLEDMYKYSSTAFLKHMGRFDVSTGYSVEEYILKPNLKGKEFARQVFAPGKYNMGYADDVTGYLSTKADWITWGHLMNAVMAEIEDNTTLVRGTEEFNKVAGRRFDEIVNQSQVYDSSLVKSPIMRSRNPLTQMASAFMTEPTLSYNLVLDGVVERKTNKKYLGRTVAAYMMSIIANALLKSVTGAMRGDDEEKTFLEKYLEKFVYNVTNDIIPVLNLPYVSSIIDALGGKTVENQAFGVLTDAVEAVTKSGDKLLQYDYWGAFKSFVGVFNAFGYPVKNIVRDVESIVMLPFKGAPLSDTTLEGMFEAAVEGFSEAANLGGTSKTSKLKRVMVLGSDKAIKKEAETIIKKYVSEGKSVNQAKGYIKSSLNNYWKPIYKKAGDKQRAEIRKALHATGVYGNVNDVIKVCNGWLEE